MKNTLVLFVAVLLSIQTQYAFSSRQTKLLDDGWRFAKGIFPESVITSNFDDSGWQQVQVPHDWAIAGPFNMNNDMRYTQIIEDGDKEPKLRTGFTGSLPTFGMGWYRHCFRMPEVLDTDRIAVEFDGVMNNASIYLNGHFVGFWPYGYTSFSFDVTDYYLREAINTLVVKVDNKPEMSRFYPGAGIYRNVRVVKTSSIHIPFCGTYITTPSVSLSKSTVNIKTKIKNYALKGTKVKLVTEILSPEGKLVNTITTTQIVSDSADYEQQCVVKKAALWDIYSPNLYTAYSKVYHNENLVDSYSTTFGFRSIEFDPNNGFLLNGKYTKIKGVCLHHDLGPVGTAAIERALERQLEILQAMGCNAVRTSHNPPSPELLNLCDRMGILVQVEFFDEWKIGKCPNSYHLLFDEWAEKDVCATIHRDRNHPSVIMWSIGNEVREQQERSGAEIARFLSAICHREDPTRPTTGAFNHHFDAIKNGLADEIDIVGFNYKPYDYVKVHQEKPNYILYGSETASTVTSRGVYNFPAVKNSHAWNYDYQLSSYDLDYVPWGSIPDVEFAQLEDNKFTLGEFVWTGFDYLGEPTPYNEGTPAKSSYFGIVDLAGIPKDRYYLYQSHWSDKPMLHVLPHWTWPDRIGQEVPIFCYTNYPKAELFVNGESMGVQEKNNSSEMNRYRLMWRNVVYQPGEIKIVALDEDGVPQTSKVIKTAGNPYKIVLTADRIHLKSDGKDLSYITAEVVDKDGNQCPRATSMLYFTVTGAGTLKGICNGDPTDLTSFSSNYMRLFSGKLVAVIETTPTAGTITVSALSERLKAGKVVLTTNK